MKRKDAEWAKIFATDTCDKGRISKNLNNSCNSTTTTTKEKKWAKDLNRHFSQEDTQMVNRNMRSCFASWLIREMQIKTRMQYHLTPVRMPIIKKARNEKC